VDAAGARPVFAAAAAGLFVLSLYFRRRLAKLRAGHHKEQAT
jgi:hypothetical protein